MKTLLEVALTPYTVLEQLAVSRMWQNRLCLDLCSYLSSQLPLAPSGHQRSDPSTSDAVLSLLVWPLLLCNVSWPFPDAMWNLPCQYSFRHYHSCSIYPVVTEYLFTRSSIFEDYKFSGGKVLKLLCSKTKHCNWHMKSLRNMLWAG